MKGNMITKQEMETMTLEHRHGGNGWVMIEDVDSEYARVVAAGAGLHLGHIVYLAAKDRLSLGYKSEAISSELRPEVDKLRKGIRAGQLQVQKNRVVVVGSKKA